MATLVVHVDDALLERIADAAQERGEDTEHLIVEVLMQAFQSKATEDEMTLADNIQAVLAPFWAEQDQEESGRTRDTTGNSVSNHGRAIRNLQ